MVKFILISICLILSKYKINLNMIISSIMMIMILSKISFHPMNSMNLIISVDNLSIMMITLSIMSTLLIILSSNNIKKIFNTIYPIMITLVLTFSMSNMFMFYIFFETVLIPTMILITKTGNQPERLQAGIYLIIYTITASLPLLICILSMKNNFSFYWGFIMMYKFKMYLLMMMAFLVKMPMFLTHLWLPKAHVEAPLEGSMVLAAILLKLGGYGLIRLIPMCYKMNSIKPWMMSISILGASMTSMNCIRQKDMKALVAYSSVAHMALALTSIFVVNKIGLTGAIIMMVAHGLSSSALFLLVNDLYTKIHSRNIIILKGLISISPNINFWWFIFLALNMAAPPSINILSEVFIMSSLVSWSMLMILPLMLTSFLTAAFCISLYISMSHNKNSMKFHKNSQQKLYLSLFTHLFPSILLLMKTEMMII